MIFFFLAKDNRKLMFMYLANDVIQNSKKKGPEFGKEFGIYLPKAFEHMKGFDEKTRERLNRLLIIWEERGVYDKTQIREFKSAFDAAAEPVKEPGTPPLRKKQKIDVEKIKVNINTINLERTNTTCHFEKKKIISIALFSTLFFLQSSTPKPEKKEKKKSETEIEVDGTKELHVTLSPRTPAGDPPETEELIKALMVITISKNINRTNTVSAQIIKYLDIERIIIVNASNPLEMMI